MDYKKIEFNLPDKTGDCWNLFLNSLAYNFDKFVMYKEAAREFYFKEMTNEEKEECQDWINNFKCSEAEEELYNISDDITINTIIRTVDPTIYENLEKDILWINKRTGEMFTCIDNTIDRNIWRGTSPGKLIRPIPPADKLDFFNDGSCVGFHKLTENALDSTGKYHGVDRGIEYKQVFDGFVASSIKKNGTIKIKKLPFDSNTETVTISAWIKWTGINSVMPFGWNNYDIYLNRGYLGFNTARGDIFGFDYTPYKNKWVYAVFEFKKGEPGKIYLNGQEIAIGQIMSSFGTSTAVMNSTLTIFGWKTGSSYRKFGEIGRVRIFNRSLTPQEIIEITSSEVELIRNLGGNV